MSNFEHFWQNFKIIKKVDAKEFPNVGKIPRWQFATINAGDCLYLPSQMWHQVKSYGETNRAVAFLFFKYEDKTELDTKECGQSPIHIPLSAIDVDWPYSGTGMMPMGHTELVRVQDSMKSLVNETSGRITKRSTYRHIYRMHSAGAINKKVVLEKTKALYNHLFTIADGNKKKMNADLIENLTRDQIRAAYDWLFPIEPANSYEHEYSAILPEDLEDIIANIRGKDRSLQKEDFIKAYTAYLGTEKFANEFWERLAGEKTSVNDETGNFEEAMRPYEEHRRNAPDEEADDEATITTPQGHVSQPKKRKGGYFQGEDEEDETKNEVEEKDVSTNEKEEL